MLNFLRHFKDFAIMLTLSSFINWLRSQKQAIYWLMMFFTFESFVCFLLSSFQLHAKCYLVLKLCFLCFWLRYSLLYFHQVFKFQRFWASKSWLSCFWSWCNCFWLNLYNCVNKWIFIVLWIINPFYYFIKLFFIWLWLYWIW